MNHSKQESLVKCIPAKKVRYVSYQEYLELVKLVPLGKVTREIDILTYLAKKYNTKDIAIDYYNSVGINSYEIPLWKVLSTRGYLYNSRYYTKDRQKELLTEESHTIIARGVNDRSLMVKDYKAYLFNFNTI